MGLVLFQLLCGSEQVNAQIVCGCDWPNVLIVFDVWLDPLFLQDVALHLFGRVKYEPVGRVNTAPVGR